MNCAQELVVISMWVLMGAAFVVANQWLVAIGRRKYSEGRGWQRAYARMIPGWSAAIAGGGLMIVGSVFWTNWIGRCGYAWMPEPLPVVLLVTSVTVALIAVVRLVLARSSSGPIRVELVPLEDEEFLRWRVPADVRWAIFWYVVTGLSAIALGLASFAIGTAQTVA